MPSGLQKPKARSSSTRRLSRRSSLKAMGVTASAALLSRPSPSEAQSAPSAANPQFKIRQGRIRQSIMGWTFNPMPTAELARLCKDIGLVAMEGIEHKDYPLVRELGLDISLVGSHGFAKGPYNRANHSAVAKALREGIDTRVRFPSPAPLSISDLHSCAGKVQEDFNFSNPFCPRFEVRNSHGET